MAHAYDYEGRYWGTHREDPEGAMYCLMWLRSVNPLFSYNVDQWIWCARCERAYSFLDLKQFMDHRIRMMVRRCPVEGCTGSMSPETLPEMEELFSDIPHSPEIRDFHPWLRECPPRKFNPQYPEVPEAFGYYPLKGE